MALCEFMTWKTYFEFNQYIHKNNDYTPIWVCWIRFLNKFWHKSAHIATKLALRLWKSTNFSFLIFDQQSNGLKFKISTVILGYFVIWIAKIRLAILEIGYKRTLVNLAVLFLSILINSIGMVFLVTMYTEPQEWSCNQWAR